MLSLGGQFVLGYLTEVSIKIIFHFMNTTVHHRKNQYIAWQGKDNLGHLVIENSPSR